MKSSKLILGCLATIGLTAGAASVMAEVDRDAIAERLKPVGQLCLQGEDCGTAAAAASGADNGEGGVDGAGIYGQVCAACHDTGAAGAPRRGEEGEWSERIDQGWETLLDHAINGFNAMPARGGNPNLSDEEVAAATAHLLEPVMDVPETGGDDAAAEEAVSEEGPVEEDAEAAAVATEDAAADEEATGDEEANGASDIDGEAIYNQACMACHMTGAAGAPRRGEAGEWEGRIDQDIETLYDHAINGIGAMPPKGGHTNLSDDEVRAAVDFLVEPVK
ncbi:cytochrome c5 family protein [Billgrantia tianxiuensis]|uniref:Cytochrome c5 family protein n=1 Tax=Billgrantia tianxiuensis TaxID=2497861 RepID=A0A6I6SVK7_9GAMM|nr:c-type cytochrome [Halomonas tianxiuensis]MCE8035315.1 cytochrome c5 family protein [Halomonas sp. MCCC 1A11057]QHC51880.1 cytochrome c5 family protein [Halomonas tianxiuensis]